MSIKETAEISSNSQTTNQKNYNTENFAHLLRNIFFIHSSILYFPFITIMNKSLKCIFIRLISFLFRNGSFFFIFHNSLRLLSLCLWLFIQWKGKSRKITDYTQNIWWWWGLHARFSFTNFSIASFDNDVDLEMI